MAAQQGFQYEINATNFLKPLGLVPKSFQPAGASHDQPDLMLQYKNKQAGCELKITDASAGSLVLKYDFSKKKDPWGFNDIDPNDVEKKFLRDLAIRTGALKEINRQWKEVPLKGNPLTPKKMDKEKMYRSDIANFRDVKKDISATEIEAYYNNKKTYYVNIGTHGLFLFGNADPLKINENVTKKKLPKIETFGNSSKAWYRARVQYKGSGNYQFTFELQFKVQKKSEYNIAPIVKNSVTILKEEAALHCFV